MNIAVIGLWHLGEIVSASFAELGHCVIGIDENKETIENLQKGIPPLDEPGLRELLKKHLDVGTLSFTTDFSSVKNCEAVFMTFDTPVGENDEPELSVLFETAEKIAPHLNPTALFAVVSQVPVGTTKELMDRMKQKNPGLTCDLAYFPENLQLGKALDCLLKPDRVVVGADTDRARERLEVIIQKITAPRLTMNIASAEMSKHALNAFLATSLSFIYNISDLCEEAGADVTDVAAALRSDSRIGPSAYLDASLGFSGGTLMRDLKTLVRFAKSRGRDVPVVEGVQKTNEERRKNIARHLENLLGVPLKRLKLGILGITYKPGTSTLRRSLGVELMRILTDAGVAVGAYDPQAPEEEFSRMASGTLARDPYQMAEDCRGVLLVTAWPEFKELDFKRLREKMAFPYLLFDTRNFFKERETEIREAGLYYVGMGRPTL